MSSYWHANNVSTLTIALENFAKNEAKKEVLRRMRSLATAMVDLIDSKFRFADVEFPEWTSNLHDATGIAIYDDGRVDMYIPTQRATSPQQSPIGEDEWGTLELEFAINQGASKFSKGLWLVMFSASSYADTVEEQGSPAERGQKFFTTLVEHLGMKLANEFGAAIVDSNGEIGFYLYT